ncbi:hypothetical protein AWV79_04225 [Cupriavidus sp. UYMMa02A]|nr:hypothetical protein AWV79_04225 [Cupriavidus sp. UYMMa02A]
MIAQELGVSVQMVSTWRKRIARQGAQGIREGERSGRPPRIAQETRLQLIALACEPQEPQGRVMPTLDEIVARAIERGIVEQINCFRCLTRDYERLPETLAGPHFVVFARLMLVHAILVLQGAYHRLGRSRLFGMPALTAFGAMRMTRRRYFGLELTDDGIYLVSMAMRACES